VLSPRDAVLSVNALAEEIARRIASADSADSAPEPVFMVIHNLSRFRELKKGEDYSFGEDESTSAGKKLATILREGPPVGVHALIWCDSYNNATRWLDRQSLRDFEMRTLFQMSATDSSNLIDSPAASKLGAHTAIFHSEERGQAEKFRPYKPPSATWLAWVGEQWDRPRPAN
jgi:S-DNA-T family DNA segregation ATPase FtsK/SpoIIIE